MAPSFYYILRSQITSPGVTHLNIIETTEFGLKNWDTLKDFEIN